MTPTLALLVNPNARAVKRRYLTRDPFWRRYLRPERVHVTADVRELDQVIGALRENRIGAIAVLGGDGTLHCTIDALVRHYADRIPTVLALAGGTMNGIQRALGTGGHPETTLRRALQDLEEGTAHLTPRCVVRVADASTGRTLHGFSFATGMVYRALQQYYETPNPGLVAAIRASLLPLTQAPDGTSIDAAVDGAPWLAERPHTLVVSIFDNPLLWFRPFGDGPAGGKAFRLGMTAMRRREIVPRLWSIFRGTCTHPRLRVGAADDVVARSTCGGYVIDGELYRTDGGFDVRLSAGPAIRFAAPAR